jgi:hypothetical protein
LGKDIKRLATGKDVKSRAGQEIAKSQDASMKGDTKTSKKHFDRYDKLDKLANKDVAENIDLSGGLLMILNTLKTWSIPISAFAAVAAAYGVGEAAKYLHKGKYEFEQIAADALETVDKTLLDKIADKLLTLYQRQIGNDKSVAEERMSAAVRMQRAADRQRAKSNASLRRTPSSIPKSEPKKDEKIAELNFFKSSKVQDPVKPAATSSDIRKFFQTNKSQNEPNKFSKNSTIVKNLPQKVYVKNEEADTGSNQDTKNISEKMLPKSAFAGSKKNKLGSAGQWKNTGPSKNRPARAGDLVGGDSIQPKGVPISEDVENIMDALINKIIFNEAVSNNK